MPTTSAGPRRRTGTGGSGAAVDRRARSTRRRRRAGSGRACRRVAMAPAAPCRTHGQKAQVGCGHGGISQTSTFVSGHELPARAAAIESAAARPGTRSRCARRGRRCAAGAVADRHDGPARSARSAPRPATDVVAEARAADAPHRRAAPPRRCARRPAAARRSACTAAGAGVRRPAAAPGRPA